MEFRETYSFAYGNVDDKTAWYRSLEGVVAHDGLEYTIDLVRLFPEKLTGGANTSVPAAEITPLS